MNDMEMLSQFNEDVKWLHDNFEEIQEEHPKEYVAVVHKEDEREIESDKDLKRLIKTLKKDGIDPALTLVEFVYEKGARVIF